MSIDIVHPALSDYLLDHATPADEVLRDLAAETRRLLPDNARMQISHDQGTLLTLLVKLTGTLHAVEVGTFTGYSSICIARGLAPGGRLLACDVSEEWTGTARRYWERAGVADRIELRIAPAAETLRALPREEYLDFAFIDADKVGYPVYYEELLTRLRPGGVIVLDNVLREGRVLDPAAREEPDLVIRELNDAITADERVESVLLPVRDGVTVVRKR
ncbi:MULTISPECIES: O-methyltransferase [Streptomyces]|uniref:Class I SAM-dependent methyltransferase n=1 Tax=Streptomyces cheonanensis TaxID=312720 RepID=A0ABN2VMW3_9ACTN|nr:MULTISPECIES: O-methyltransferase [Streptomyces]MCK1815642.1 O-methyltransferase [Streptomyces sp. XM4011]QKV69085.1 class I SAM-dependent methyltransferase [Streptomyces harbinensis]